MTVGFAIFDDFEYFLWTGHESFSNSFHVWNTVLVLVHAQVHFGH
jgi:hypothetical protein